MKHLQEAVTWLSDRVARFGANTVAQQVFQLMVIIAGRIIPDTAWQGCWQVVSPRLAGLHGRGSGRRSLLEERTQ
jgi:hypothetical protein